MKTAICKMNRLINLAQCAMIGVVLLIAAPIHGDVPQVISEVAHVIHPSNVTKARYEIGHVPAESGVYFQASIDGYNVKLKRDVINGLKNDVERNDAQAKELLYLFNQLPSTHSIKSSIMLIMRAITAHKGMLKEYGNQKDIIDRNDQVYIAILLQGSVVLTNNTRSQLLSILDEINNSLMYWREQKNHPTHYFLHKSPLKWALGKPQAEEIENNIKKLEQLDHTICDILGRMTKHLYEFSPASSADEVYGWIEHLLDIVACVGIYKDKPTVDTRFDKVAENVRFKLNCVSDLKNKILGKIKFAKKPTHFVRNWLAYTLAIGAAYQGYKFYAHNTDLVNQAAMRSLESMRGLWQSATDPVKDAWRTVFPSSLPTTDHQRQGFESSYEKITDDLVPGLKKNKEILAKLIEDSSDQRTLKQKALVDLQTLLEQPSKEYYIFSSRPWTKAEIGVILANAEKNDFNLLREKILKVGATSPALRVGLERVTKELEFAYVIDSLPVLQELIEQLVDIGWESGIIADYIINFLDKSIKANELNIKFAALIPAFGLGFGFSKLYSWYTARDYSEVRLALIEINSLFIEVQSPLSDSDYGKLIYLLQGLKSKAMRYLPTQDNMRDDFLMDIAKLESQQFTVETKRRIIKNMFNKYAFLSLKEKSA